MVASARPRGAQWRRRSSHEPASGRDRGVVDLGHIPAAMGDLVLGAHRRRCWRRYRACGDHRGLFLAVHGGDAGGQPSTRVAVRLDCQCLRAPGGHRRCRDRVCHHGSRPSSGGAAWWWHCRGCAGVMDRPSCQCAVDVGAPLRSRWTPAFAALAAGGVVRGRQRNPGRGDRFARRGCPRQRPTESVGGLRCRGRSAAAPEPESNVSADRIRRLGCVAGGAFPRRAG